MSVNQIALMLNHHYVTVSNIIDIYKSQGRTSLPYNLYCPVSEDDYYRSEVQVLDLKAIDIENRKYSDDDLISDRLI